jgi:hypothetical protein
MRVPEIRARAVNEFARALNTLAEALAARTGRDPGDIRVRTLAGAVVGVMMSVFLPPEMGDEVNAGPDFHEFPGPDSVSRLDEALALLEEGLPL